MTLRHLKIFIVVCELGKMRSAAEKLHISQPAISQAITELEQYYDVQLFERINNRIYITEFGKLFLQQARHTIEAFQQLETFVLESKGQKSLRVGASVSVGTVLLPQIIQHLRQKYPAINIEVIVNNTTIIEQSLQQNALDIAIVEGAIKNHNLVCEDIMQDELVVVVGLQHPLAKMKKIHLSDLENYTLISRELGSVERNQFEMYLQQTNATFKANWQCSNTEAIKMAVILNQGVAVLSRLLVSEELATNKLVSISISDIDFKRMIKLVYLKDKYFSDTMQIFKSEAIDVLNSTLKHIQ